MSSLSPAIPCRGTSATGGGQAPESSPHHSSPRTHVRSLVFARSCSLRVERFHTLKCYFDHACVFERVFLLNGSHHFFLSGWR